jgi:hypothetical protein
MSHDIKSTIEKMKDMAIGRCRERIDQAACKAKKLIDGSGAEEQKERNSNSNQPVGMTSFLKKRHGL